MNLNGISEYSVKNEKRSLTTDEMRNLCRQMQINLSEVQHLKVARNCYIIDPELKNDVRAYFSDILSKYAEENNHYLVHYKDMERICDELEIPLSFIKKLKSRVKSTLWDLSVIDSDSPKENGSKEIQKPVSESTEAPTNQPEFEEEKVNYVIDGDTKKDEKVEEVQKSISVSDFIPNIDPNFVPFGDFDLIEKIIKSSEFFPTLITGESGCGKTEMVIQSCAKHKRPFFRLNITSETDEVDLIGHFSLDKGDMTWVDSPLISAMKIGGVVLLDEIFAGSPNRMMTLQGILEGKPYLNKKTGEIIKPAPGFNIIACDNSKGNGDDTGMYLGLNIQNLAFLERFPICIEHDFPSQAIEKKILNKFFSSMGMEEKEFVDNLTRWSDVTRITYKEDAIDSFITTRRLLHICKAYSIFKDRKLAIKKCISRFEIELQNSFWLFYMKIDPTIDPVESEKLLKEEEIPATETNTYDQSYI